MHASNFVTLCLEKQACQRPTIAELLEHSWMKKWIADPVIKAETTLLVSENLASFKHANTLQASVLSLLSNLTTTSEELREYSAMFEKLDKTNDGKLTLAEMKEGLKQLGFGDRDEADWDDMLKAMDASGDGQIDFNEFLTATYDRRKVATDQNIKVAFDLFDRDKSGTISQEELFAVFGTHALDSASTALWAEITQQVGCNSKAEITFAQFSECMHSILKLKADQK